MQDDIYNAVGGKHLIDEESWVVSLMRKKQGQGAEHAFLIIEGIKNGEYKIVRADLFIKSGSVSLQVKKISAFLMLKAYRLLDYCKF